MLMFTLAISYLTTSNLPWFMGLTFQVPMQYCSLQNWSLLWSRDTPHLGIVFALTRALHSSGAISLLFPAAYCHLPIWGIHLSVSHLFVFSYCSWCSPGKNTEVVCHSLLQWTMFCQNSTMTHPSRVALCGMAHWVRQGCDPCDHCD